MSSRPALYSQRKRAFFLANLSYSTRKARGRSSSGHEVLLKVNKKDDVRLVGNLMDLDAQGHLICSDLMC